MTRFTGRLLFLCCVAVPTVLGCGVVVTPVVQHVTPLRTLPVSGRSGPDESIAFGRMFCDTLAHNPDAGVWGFCERYFEPTSGGTAVGAFASPYRVLVVPGILGQCVEQIAKPFEDAVPHMRTAHQLELEYVSVAATGSCKHNAAQIATELAKKFTGTDQRKYILVGYSKGASDLLEAFRDHAIVRDKVVAVITVAGSILGSRLLQAIPEDVLKFVTSPVIGPCDLGDKAGIDEMRRGVRAKAMATLTLPDTLRVYSIAASSEVATTARVLRKGYLDLMAYSVDQDSQMIHEDAIVPTATYLGIAKGDHWAVALPFNKPASEPAPELKRLIAAAVDHPPYPRAALIEAALRFVVADLARREP